MLFLRIYISQIQLEPNKELILHCVPCDRNSDFFCFDRWQYTIESTCGVERQRSF